MAAGRGTRLRPITDTVPKALIPIAGCGALPRLLEELPDNLERIILVVGHLGAAIHDAIGPWSNGRPVVYVEQNPLNGTGGAVQQARKHIRSELFLVLNGDDIFARSDLVELTKNGRAVLVAKKVLERPRYVWQIEGERLRRLKLQPSGYVGYETTGAYCLGHESLEAEPVPLPGKPEEASLPHIISQLAERFIYRPVEASFWLPCGSPEEVRQAEHALYLRKNPSRLPRSQP
jgi:NDP-sugar pyrophosphorylase family protein